MVSPAERPEIEPLDMEKEFHEHCLMLYGVSPECLCSDEWKAARQAYYNGSYSAYLLVKAIRPNLPELAQIRDELRKFDTKTLQGKPK